MIKRLLITEKTAVLNEGNCYVFLVDENANKIELKKYVASKYNVTVSKVNIAKKKVKLINPQIKIKTFKVRIDNKNIEKIFKNYDFIVDGSDNFKTKFLLNEYSLKYKKILIVGAISKMDGHIFTFDFKNKNNPCLKCFYQSEPSDDILNCEVEGILGPIAGIVGNIQAIEILKKILN